MKARVSLFIIGFFVLGSLISCPQPENHTITYTSITLPSNYAVNIEGLSVVSFGQTPTYTVSYMGTPTSYEWFLNGELINGEASNELTVSLEMEQWNYGTNILSLKILDTNGLSYMGSKTLVVGE